MAVAELSSQRIGIFFVGRVVSSSTLQSRRHVFPSLRNSHDAFNLAYYFSKLIESLNGAVSWNYGRVCLQAGHYYVGDICRTRHHFVVYGDNSGNVSVLTIEDSGTLFQVR